jgi:hypothetical protein
LTTLSTVLTEVARSSSRKPTPWRVPKLLEDHLTLHQDEGHGDERDEQDLRGRRVLAIHGETDQLAERTCHQEQQPQREQQESQMPRRLRHASISYARLSPSRTA